MIDRRIFGAKRLAMQKGIDASVIYLGREELMEVRSICRDDSIVVLEDGKIKTVLGLKLFEVCEDSHLAVY